MMNRRITTAVFLVILSLTSCSIQPTQPSAVQSTKPKTTITDSTTIEPGTVNDTVNTYPINFFVMKEGAIDFSDMPEPIELYERVGAHGLVRVLNYGTVMTYAMEYGGYEHHVDIGYKSDSFVTSEGISVGSTRIDVLEAYQDYGIMDIFEGYPGDNVELEDFLKDVENIAMDGFNGYRWLCLIKALVDSGGAINTCNLLYVDNGTPEVIEQFGGLAAWIFVFDNSDIVQMIIGTSPTSS